MPKREDWLVVPPQDCLHARSCAMIAREVSRVVSDVRLTWRGITANARSITSLMGLGFPPSGEPLLVEADGDDAELALEILRALFADFSAYCVTNDFLGISSTVSEETGVVMLRWSWASPPAAASGDVRFTVWAARAGGAFIPVASGLVEQECEAAGETFYIEAERAGRSIATSPRVTVAAREAACSSSK